MARRIVIERDAGEVLMVEVDAHDEAQLQDRLKNNPDLLPLDELGITGPLMVVGRETVLTSGAADLVGLTRNGDVLVVEFKTGPQNPDFRAALAQLLDYGSDLWQMTLEVFESTVAVRYFTGTHCPAGASVHGLKSIDAAAAATWPDLTQEGLAGLRERLGDALAHGAFHYVVVAQRFTPTMEATAGYLNEVTSRARFYLVEMVRFTGDGLNAFEARTVYRPPAQTSKANGPGTNESSFLEALSDVNYRDTVERLFEVCRGLDLRFEWGSKGTSVRLLTADKPEPVSIIWAFPPGVLGWMGLTDITFGYDPSQAATAPSARGALDWYVDQFTQLGGAQTVSKAGLRAARFSPVTLMEHEAALIDLLARVVERASSDQTA
jgi:hypothetical protein